ncbi:polyprenyl diphosphate synthase [Brachybacterium sillae]|uniref:polyprenyl diphosphate synthase n=1 Tax=Brachybacterium sillae TaxID=2810536 RepID=UPI003D818978
MQQLRNVELPDVQATRVPSDHSADASTDSPADASAVLPHHLGIIVDGNRRWARTVGASTAEGHRRGAERVGEVLGWCRELGIPLVTVWLLSTDNLRRPPSELEALMGIIAGVAEDCAAAGHRVRVIGDLSLVPPEPRQRILAAAQGSGVAGGSAAAHRTGTADDALTVNLAIGYGGREDVAGAVRTLVAELAAQGVPADAIAERIDAGAIGGHLATAGQPDPDLIIRTSGSSACPVSCCGSRSTPNCGSATPIGRTSAARTSPPRWRISPGASDASAADGDGAAPSAERPMTLS